MSPNESHRRWRLVLGGDAESAQSCGLSTQDMGMDSALEALYDPAEGKRSGGLENSAPRVARWLGDIRQ